MKKNKNAFYFQNEIQEKLLQDNIFLKKYYLYICILGFIFNYAMSEKYNMLKKLKRFKITFMCKILYVSK